MVIERLFPFASVKKEDYALYNLLIFKHYPLQMLGH